MWYCGEHSTKRKPMKSFLASLLSSWYNSRKVEKLPLMFHHILEDVVHFVIPALLKCALAVSFSFHILIF